MKYILIIAGSDSSGGAGIQADIRTVANLGGHALAAVTALTAQNSMGILDIHDIPATFILKQIQAVAEDIAPHAVKIGMINRSDAVMAVAEAIQTFCLPNVVLDPVMRATTGRRLLEPEALSIMKRSLLPLVHVVTPNIQEAEILSGKSVSSFEDARRAAKSIHGLGPQVVVTGGHFSERCVDILYDGKETHLFSDTKISTDHTHGTGCVFSSALALALAEKSSVIGAVALAHDFVRQAIISGYACGRGAGTVSPS
jgi:hydroxymethylpyrimidine/phosphomethylpyrimidine kinase